MPEVSCVVEGAPDLHLPFATISRDLEVVVELEIALSVALPDGAGGLDLTGPYGGTFADAASHPSGP